MAIGVGSVSGQTKTYANSQTNGVAGLCVLCGVANPTNAINNTNLTDYSEFTVTVGLLGVTVSQTLIFPSANSNIGCDEIVIGMGSGASLLSANLLGGVTIETFNGSTSNGDSQNINSSALTLLSNQSNGEVRIRPTAKYDRVKVTLSSALLGALTNFRLFYAYSENGQPSLASIPTQTICAGQAIDLNTLNPGDNNNVSNGTYVWSTTQGGTALQSTTVIPPTGNNTYWVRYSKNACYSDQSVVINVNPLPTLSTTQTATTVPTGSSITFNATSSASTIKWYDSSGALKFTGANPTFGPFATPGTYSYEVIADNGTCINSTTVTFSVYSTTTCPTLSKRVYANSTTWSSIITGYVTDDALAADGDPKTSSTLTSLVGLLGIGTVTQNLFWNNTVAAGTPATIKLGLGTGVLSLIPNVSVVGIKKNGTVTTEIGTAQIVNASLLKLLPGDNTLEFTITPSDKTGPVAYDGIRVVLGSLVSVAQSARVFDAYYYTPTPAVDCTKGDVTDIVYGVKDIGVGALSVTVGVQNAWNSVDGDMNTYATMLSGAGVLAQAREQIIFSSPSLPGDSLRIITSTGASLLGVNLLTGFSIQRYLGGVPVGTPIDNTSTLLSIKLLSGNTRAAIVLSPTPEPYDRVEILYGGVANVLTSINIHEVQRVTTTRFAGSDLNNAITVCKGQIIPLPAPTDNCTTFELYDVPTGGTPITPTVINTALFDGTKIFYIQPVRFGCRLLTREPVTVTVNPLPTISAIIGNANICVGVGYTFTNTSTDPGVWSTDNAAVATVDNTGFVKGINVGTANIIYTITNGTTNCSNSTSMQVNVSALPAISLGSIPAICLGSTAASLPYTSVSSGSLKYDIIWNTTYLTNVSGADLPASPIQLSILPSAPTGTYTGTFTIRNSTSGCTNSYALSITINPLPTISITTSPNACKGLTNATLVYTVTGTPTTYSIDWGTSALTDGFVNITANTPLPASPINITIPSTANATTYTGSITVKNANGCIGTPVSFNLIIHSKPLKPQILAQ